MNDLSRGSADDDSSDEASRREDMMQFFEDIELTTGVKVTPIHPPRICLGSEVIGQTEDDFLLWQWKGPDDFTYGKIPKSQLPELIAREKAALREKQALEKGAPDHARLEKELANVDVERKIRTVVYSAQDTFKQKFTFFTCPKPLEGMEIIGASEEYVVAWKETDGKITAIAKRWADLGEGYELVEVPIPFAPSKISKGIKSAIAKVFGRS